MNSPEYSIVRPMLDGNRVHVGSNPSPNRLGSAQQENQLPAITKLIDRQGAIPYHDRVYSLVCLLVAMSEKVLGVQA